MKSVCTFCLPGRVGGHSHEFAYEPLEPCRLVKPLDHSVNDAEQMQVEVLEYGRGDEEDVVLVEV